MKYLYRRSNFSVFILQIQNQHIFRYKTTCFSVYMQNASFRAHLISVYFASKAPSSLSIRTCHFPVFPLLLKPISWLSLCFAQWQKIRKLCFLKSPIFSFICHWLKGDWIATNHSKKLRTRAHEESFPSHCTSESLNVSIIYSRFWNRSVTQVSFVLLIHKPVINHATNVSR